MNRRTGMVLCAAVAATFLSVMTTFTAAAAPGGQPPPSGDHRATPHDGDAKTCPDAGLSGVIVLKDDNPPENLRYLNIGAADIPAGYELTGTVVKGGSGYNVYPAQYLTNLHAPLVRQTNELPTISYWFVCGAKKETTSAAMPPPATPSGSAPTTEDSTPTTIAPTAQGSRATSGGGRLANTGATVTDRLILGSALLCLGVGLLLIVRRSRQRR